MNGDVATEDLTHAITAACWSRLPEAMRHGWRRVTLLGGRTQVPRGLVSVVVDAAKITDIDAVLVATLLEIPKSTVEAARVGVLPLVVAAAVPLDQALRVSARIVGVPHQVVPCDPDPTWRNDGPWSSVSLAVHDGRPLVRADGAWTAALRRSWAVTVDGVVCVRLPSLATRHARTVLGDLFHELELAPADVHPEFRMAQIVRVVTP